MFDYYREVSRAGQEEMVFVSASVRNWKWGHATTDPTKSVYSEARMQTKVSDCSQTEDVTS
jgi:hypothetical protein